MAAKKTPRPKKTAGRKKGRGNVQTVAKTAKVLRATDGNISEVARRFKITRNAVQKYINAHAELKTVVIEAREGLCDDSVTQLGKAARKGAGWAVRFVLSTLGRRRGFVTRQEVTGTPENAGMIPVSVHLPDNGRRSRQPDAAPARTEPPPPAGPEAGRASDVDIDAILADDYGAGVEGGAYDRWKCPGCGKVIDPADPRAKWDGAAYLHGCSQGGAFVCERIDHADETEAAEAPGG